MEGRKLFKIFLILWPVVMFLYQCNTAIEKLKHPSTVSAEEILNLKDILAPSIMICPDGQFNDTNAEDFDYVIKSVKGLGVHLQEKA